ncbi:hypothetical protein QTN47_27390 [Danxiaibacter flavus]|uniref:DUF6808 domain-containing protein n=1 Tax=Danxiaibacter flavus TaxID=3049108 RepID=A0ABV3ZQN0_9BACT|nr:hypothetical protein QNM32_27390 [Chitinophagaceae bacterium DXS]
MKQQYERLIIVALLIIIAVFALQTCFRKEKQVTDLKQVVSAKQDTLKHYKDEAGHEHGQKVLAEADMSLLKVEYQKQIDSVTELLKIKESQLAFYTGFSTESSGSIKPRVDTVFMPDSTREFNIDFSDRWMSLNGRIGKSSNINYRITDSLTVTVYSKKKNFLSSLTTYIDVFSMNPNVKVTGLTGFKIPVKKPGRFGIGPYFGYGYSDGKWSPSAGVAIQYSLIRF